MKVFVDCSYAKNKPFGDANIGQPVVHATFYKVDISKAGSTLKGRRCFRFTLDIRFGTELNIERSFGLLSGD